jgi:hypothetical protein
MTVVFIYWYCGNCKACVVINDELGRQHKAAVALLFWDFPEETTVNLENTASL